ncbi:hypothetical protein TcasGA2_TC013197 [Tribolium castaneum]|uniref:Uncharacterized protein n=1 Tax=Tribolium castaneum TaxID=7070 RepID=D6WMZ0_TRICA|nr:hypothetical protein TcasGA2_TC013197 [Tribolium castaneum]
MATTTVNICRLRGCVTKKVRVMGLTERRCNYCYQIIELLQKNNFSLKHIGTAKIMDSVRESPILSDPVVTFPSVSNDSPVTAPSLTPIIALDRPTAEKSALIPVVCIAIKPNRRETENSYSGRSMSFS